jgi:hypothetical protein
MNPIATPAPLALVSHPRTPSRAIQSIEVLVDWTPGGELSLAFVLACDLAQLRIPDPRPPARANGLWRHTCFELFVMAGRGPEYREFNFSPSGEWAVFAFRDYRDGTQADVAAAPEIVLHRTADRLQLDARIGPEHLPRAASLRLGPTAVVEGADGVLSYWALKHPPGKPDFHHSDAFAMHLESPRCRPRATRVGG